MSEAIAITIPQHGGMTVEELDLLPESRGTRYELIEGSLLVSPAASSKHQVIAGRLQRQISAALPRGLEVVETIDVKLNDITQFIPDLIVAPTRLLLREKVKVTAADVTLLVEIVSRSSRTMDRLTKPSLYASHEVPYYWRVEYLGGIVPEIVAYRLEDSEGSGDGEYGEYARSTDTGHLTVREPFDADIDAARLVADA